MPVFNEAGTVEAVIRKVLEQPLVGELTCVNDGSSDGTHQLLERVASTYMAF